MHSLSHSLTHPSSRPLHCRHVFSFLPSPPSLSPTANKSLALSPFFLSLSLSLLHAPSSLLSRSLSLTFPLSLPPPAGPWLKKPCSPPPPPLAGLHGAALHGKRGNEEETDEAATLVRDSLILLHSAGLDLFFSLPLLRSLSHRFPPTVRPRTTALDLSRPPFSRPRSCVHTHTHRPTRLLVPLSPFTCQTKAGVCAESRRRRRSGEK